MLIAKQKIRENIGEYFLYMFQVEDLVRACEFDKDIINKHIISQYQVDERLKDEIKEWYYGLSDMMESEKKQKEGHLVFLENKIGEVFDFHLYLLQNKDYTDYQNKYKAVVPYLSELRLRSGKQLNDLHLMLNAIYGVYVLKLKKQEVTQDTLESVGKISVLLSELSGKFRQYEKGDLKIE